MKRHLKKPVKKKSIRHFIKKIFTKAPKLIQDQKQLLAICDKISEGDIIAVDTEFMRERTYYPLLCLIQVNIAGKCYAIDTLSPEINLKPFFEILENKKITKIFHSSYQDIEVLIQITKKIPKSIIDTQIMANFCGFDYNVSYAKLAKKLLNKNLDKDWQRSDWQGRPLQREQIEYALIDVLYLPKIHKILHQQLVANKKVDWFEEEMRELLTKKNYDIDNQDLYKKFPLIGKSLSYKENIKLLANWRDKSAKKRNLPRSFILKDDILIKIASFNPQSYEELEKCCAGNKFLKPRTKKEIFEVLQERVITPESDSPPADKVNFRLTDEQNSLFQKARNLLQKKAKENNLKAEFIINQNDLKQIILGNKQTADVLDGWRFKVLGKDLEKLVLKE